MDPRFDLESTSQSLAKLVQGVRDEQLSLSTPCPAYAVADLVDHIGGLTLAFTAAAKKSSAPGTDGPPVVDGSRLGDGWRETIASDLSGLTAAWRDPAAWDGMTAAGGVDLPGEIAGLVALDEIVLHGWDLARATGQEYDLDPAHLAIVHDFVSSSSVPGDEASREGIFGPVVDVPRHAPLLDKVVGLAGRAPDWSR